MVVYEAFRDSALAVDTDAIQIELVPSQNGIRTGAQAGAERRNVAVRIEQSCVCWIVEIGIKIRGTVVCLVSVRHSVPT